MGDPSSGDNHIEFGIETTNFNNGSGTEGDFYFAGDHSRDIQLEEYSNTNGAWSAVPEPSSVILLLTNLEALAFISRRRLAHGHRQATRPNS